MSERAHGIERAVTRERKRERVVKDPLRESARPAATEWSAHAVQKMDEMGEIRRVQKRENTQIEESAERQDELESVSIHERPTGRNDYAYKRKPEGEPHNLSLCLPQGGIDHIDLVQ